MTTHAEPMPHIPGVVRLFDPLARRLLALGMPVGPNILLSVRGRTSGLPRQFAVAIVELDGRRWVAGTFGDANWVRNLRAAGEGAIRISGRWQPVLARELNPAETVAFFDTVLVRYFGRMRLPGRTLIRVFLRLTAPEVLDDPATAAQGCPVFELIPATD